jgi:Rps23 Pro-64 3,4-dihydroxylase Tpa1-like proline 4-hydroxylase
MEVEDMIRIYDGFIHPENISRLIKYAIKDGENMKEATIVGNDPNKGTVDKEIRRVNEIYLKQDSKSLTNVHYFNFLHHQVFKSVYFRYIQDLKIEVAVQKVEMSLLRYTKGGHYKFHVDHGLSIPRSLSFILLLNNDYEGGELQFKEVNSDEIITIENKPGRVIIWPSNFMYRHRVKPVTKGTRYPVVCWYS